MSDRTIRTTVLLLAGIALAVLFGFHGENETVFSRIPEALKTFFSVGSPTPRSLATRLGGLLGKLGLCLWFTLGLCGIGARIGESLLPGFNRRPIDARLLLALAVGLGAMVSLVSLLTLLRLVSFWTCLVLLLLPPMLTWRPLVRLWQALPSRGTCRATIREFPLLRGVLPVGLFLLLVSGLAATAPPFHLDSLVYHLAVPKAFLNAGGLVNMPANTYSYNPLNGEMIYLLFLGSGLDGMARLFHLILGFASAGWIFTLLRQRTDPGWAGLGALFLLSTPTLLVTATAAYTDLFVLFFALGGLYLLDRRVAEPETGPGPMLWAGFFCGWAVGTKYAALFTGASFCLALFALVLFCRSFRGRDVVTFFGAAVASGCFWYIRNLWFTGNPLFPYFETSELLALHLESIRTFGGDAPLHRIWFEAPLWSRFGTGYDGIIGFGFLFLPIAALLVWPPKERFRRLRPFLIGMATLLFASVLLWYLSSTQFRFLLFALAVGTLLFFVVLDHRTARPGVAAGCGLAILFHVALFFGPTAKGSPVAYALGGVDRDAFLETVRPEYAAYRFINRSLPRDAHLLLVNFGNYAYWLERSFHADTLFESYTMRKLARASKTPDDLYRRLRKRGFTHIAILHSLLTTSHPLSPYTEETARRIGEMLKTRARLLYEKDGMSVWKLR